MRKTTSKKSPVTKPKSPSKAAAEAPAPLATKAGSKAAAIMTLLRREEGATLDEMVHATGWQKHSVRGFMAGALKKQHCLTVSSEKTDNGRRYQIAAEEQQ